MHKVTIDSPVNDTHIDKDYKAMVFFGISDDMKDAVQCLILSTYTKDIVEDASVKTILLRAIMQAVQSIIDSNKLLKFVVMTDDTFVDKLMQSGEKMSMEQYNLRKEIRRILDEGKGEE